MGRLDGIGADGRERAGEAAAQEGKGASGSRRLPVSQRRETEVGPKVGERHEVETKPLFTHRTPWMETAITFGRRRVSEI